MRKMLLEREQDDRRRKIITLLENGVEVNPEGRVQIPE